jgi:hypothetical protein
VVGGCLTNACNNNSTAVYRYDPVTGSWSQLANYPADLAYLGCAGVTGEVVCAGGVDSAGNSTKATYRYDPVANSWSRGADMPFDDWGMAASGSGDDLQVVDGVTANGTEITNAVEQYDPATDTWTDLPHSNLTEFRGGGACGTYQVGGEIGVIDIGTDGPFYVPVSSGGAEVLPGYDECGTGDVSWLSESSTGFELAPGQSLNVSVTMDAGAVTTLGSYNAQLVIDTDSPYHFQPVPVTMHVSPPKTWGQLAGTVTDAATGAPIAGATVQVNTFNGTGTVQYALRTDASGRYELWLDSRYNPLQLVVSKDGYLARIQKVKIVAGTTTTVDFPLSAS